MVGVDVGLEIKIHAAIYIYILAMNLTIDNLMKLWLISIYEDEIKEEMWYLAPKTQIYFERVLLCYYTYSFLTISDILKGICYSPKRTFI